MKVLINTKASYFHLNHQEIMRLAELKNIKIYPYHRELFKSIYEPLKRGYGNEYNTYYYLNENPDFLKDPLFSDYHNFSRNDPLIHQLYYEFKDNDDSHFKTSVIVDVPDDVKWHIACDDEEQYEWVAENHRTWSDSEQDGQLIEE